MTRLTTSKAAAFGDATVTFFGGKSRGALRTGEKVYGAGVGASDGDINRSSEGRVRGRTGVYGSLGLGRRLGLIVSAMSL